MTIINVILLAIFQGVAEFLPISSSGHLAVLGAWMTTIAFAASMSAGKALATAVATLFNKVLKSAFLQTKSVSQFNSINAALFPLTAM